MDPAELEALHSTTFRLEQAWLPVAPPNHTWHAYDPLPWAEFLSGIRTAIAAADARTFLDIGCGIGTKLAYMYALGFAVRGVDHHQPYLDAARKMIHEAELEHADVRELDAIDEAIVYMYRPAVADELEDELEAHVARVLRDGAVLFLPARPDAKPPGMRQLAGCVWKKG